MNPYLFDRSRRFPFLSRIADIVVLLNIIYLNFTEAAQIGIVWQLINYSLYIILTTEVLFKGKIKIGNFGIWCILFALLGVVSNIWAVDSQLAMVQTIRLTKNLIMAFLIMNYIDSEERFKLVNYGLIFSTVILSVFVIIITPFNFGMESRLENILFLNVNLFALQAGIAFMALLHIEHVNQNRYYYLLMIPLLIIITISGTRKVLLMILAGFFLWNVLLSKRKRFLKLMVSGSLVLTILYLIFQIPSLYNLIGYRIEGMFGIFNSAFEVDMSASIRMDMINYGMELFKQKPLLGYGLDNFRALYGSTASMYTYSHNNFIEIMTSLGVMGLIVYYSLYLSIFKTCMFVKSKSPTVYYIIITLFLITVLQFGMVCYDSRYFLLILAMLYSGVIIEKKKVLF